MRERILPQTSLCYGNSPWYGVGRVCPKLSKLSKIVKLSKLSEIVRDCQNCQQLSTIVKIIQNCQNCPKLTKIIKIVQNCPKLSKLSKLSKIVKIVSNVLFQPMAGNKFFQPMACLMFQNQKVTHSLSDWVTRSPIVIGLFWTAKKQLSKYRISI